MALAQDLALQPDDERRRDDQHRGQDRAGPDRVEAARALVDTLVDQCRDVEDAVFDAEHGDRAEVGHRVQHDQQRAGQDAGQHQRDGDLAGDGEQAGARDSRRFLQGRVHALQRPADLDEDEREQVHDFDEHDAEVAVDIENRAFKAEVVHEEFVDEAGVRGKKHFPGQSADERGQHERHQEHGFHEGLVGQVGTGDQPGEKCADDGAADGGAAGDDQGVRQGFVGFRLHDDVDDVAEVELAVDPEGVEQDQQNRHRHHDDQDGDGEEQNNLGYAKIAFFRDGTHCFTTSFRLWALNHRRSRKLIEHESSSLNIRPLATASWVSILVRRCAQSTSIK